MADPGLGLPYWSRDVAELSAALHSGPRGLSSQTAAEQLRFTPPRVGAKNLADIVELLSGQACIVKRINGAHPDPLHTESLLRTVALLRIVRLTHQKRSSSMSLSMYQASVPAFLQMLNNLSAILDKAESYAGNRNIDPEVLLNYRLAPDMFPFVRQIQIAADLAKGAAARLAGVEVPRHDDTEKTFADLKARITNTATFVQSIQPSDIDGSEGRDITLTLGEHRLSFKGQPYLVHFVLPNFYFHCTTAYDILRHCGVELGKRDFIGDI